MAAPVWLARALALVGIVVAMPLHGAGDDASEAPRLFVAASLTDAFIDVARAWEGSGGRPPLLVFGGSAQLAKQVDSGAPADLYSSADPRWMDQLEQRGRIESGSRVDLLGNGLVLVAPRNRNFALRMERGAPFAAAFEGKLCMGEPGTVPAGTYAREALRSLGWWDAVAGRIVGTDDVRAALAFVARGECGAGIVYSTDARASDRVVVVGVFPADSHRPIVYSFGIVTGARPEARRLMEALRSDPTMHEILVRHGFQLRAASGR
jgi:molybdate transport system substrate-binding protein